MSEDTRFDAMLRTDPVTGCIEWTGTRHGQGYGFVTRGGRQMYTHRYAWTLAHGPIPDGLCVCHHCDNPPCCNVDHLFLGTHSENLKDAARKGRHAFPDNRGERHGMAKLTEDQVRAIRLDQRPRSVIAREYGVLWDTVRVIQKRQSWTHVE